MKFNQIFFFIPLTLITFVMFLIARYFTHCLYLYIYAFIDMPPFFLLLSPLLPCMKISLILRRFLHQIMHKTVYNQTTLMSCLIFPRTQAMAGSIE